MNQPSSPFYPSPQGAVQFAYPPPYPPPVPSGSFPYPLSGAPPRSHPPNPNPQTSSYFRQFSQQPLPPLPQQQHVSTVNAQPRGGREPQHIPSAYDSPAASPGAEQDGRSSAAHSQDVRTHDGLLGNNAHGRPHQQIHNNGDDDVNMNDEEGEDDAMGPIFHLPAPPEETYPSEADLEKAMHAWSLEHGYELVKRASKKNAQGQIYKRYYHCSKHGSRSRSKLTPATRKRANRRSNRIGCPMSIASVATDPSNPEGQWQIRHRKSHHNHGPLEAVALAGHRRRARVGDVEKAVDGLFAIGTSTSQVLQFLQKTNPNGLFTRTDVANMKLKWKKHGTCADRMQRQEAGRSNKDSNIACTPCRQKHERCGKERPFCHNCAVTGADCTYEDDVRLNAGQDQGVDDDEQRLDINEYDSIDGHQIHNADAYSTLPHPTHSSQQDLIGTREILATLQNFQQEHIAPRKLTLTSSSVEVLAESTCGNGSSYRYIPILYQEQDWPSFRDAIIEASRRENHYDVLTGQKKEPDKPPEPTSNNNAVEVEEWNEYIKQLAIYNRRNDMLLASLSSKLAPNFRNRIHGLSTARDVWAVLDELCLPRGSQQAYTLYSQLQCITLANSADLNDYIGRLESTYAQFKLLKLNHSLLTNSTGNPAEAQRPKVGADVLPDEAMCLIFLHNLGPAWKRWVEGLLATNNIAGFGTGQRVGFRDVCRRAVGYEVMQRQSRDS